MKKAVDMETLLIENETIENGCTTLVSAQTSTVGGSLIAGMSYEPAPDFQNRKVLSTYELSANETDAELQLVSQSALPTRSERESSPARAIVLSADCRVNFEYSAYDVHNRASISLGSEYDRLTFFGVTDVEFTEPVASPSDLIAYFEIEGQPI